jgi:hypothetical protein
VLIIPSSWGSQWAVLTSHQSLLVLLLLSDVEANMLLDRLLELGMVSIDGTVMNFGDDYGKGTMNP